MPLASRTGEVKYRMKGEPGADAYMITTSVSQIYQNMSGSFYPSTFRCYGYQGKSPATGMYLQVWGSSDNQNWTYITYRQLTAGNNYLDVSVKSAYKYYIIRLYDHNPSTDIDAEPEFFASATISVIKDGEPGAQGNPGAKMRMRKWTSGTYYMRGSDSEEWYDIVEYNNRLYLCMVSHTSSSYNSPISGTGHWEIAQNWTFIATKLLLAEKITADMINADGITAKNVDITGKITATSGSFKGEITATSGKIGGFTIESGRLVWKAKDYFGNDSRSVKIGVSSSDSEGIIDITFGAATTGKYGIKVIGSNAGGASVFGATRTPGSSEYPPYGMSYAGFFVGPMFCVDTNHGIGANVVAASSFRYIQSINSSGSYTYKTGVNWGDGLASPDLDNIRLIVRGGLIVGYTNE